MQTRDVLFGISRGREQGKQQCWNFRRLDFASDLYFKAQNPLVVDPYNMAGMEEKKLKKHWNHFLYDDADRFF